MRSFYPYIFFIQILFSCSETAVLKEPDSGIQNPIQVISDTLVHLTELQACDILVKPNLNWLPGTEMVMGGRGFGHAALVIEGGKDSSTINLLRKVRIFESQARIVPAEYELRLAQGYLEGNDFRFSNITFGPQNSGFRYRLRFDLTPDQRDSIIQFVLKQDPDISSWRALKRLRTKLPSGMYKTPEEKNIWYCSLLIWEAFYEVLGIDLDPNGGIMVYPNDLIGSPYFDNDAKHKQKRVRF